VNKTTKPFSSSPVFNGLGRKNCLKGQFIHTFQARSFARAAKFEPVPILQLVLMPDDNRAALH
jgi:hypothetical protein